MFSVAIPAVRRFDVTQRRHLRMKRVVVSRKASLMTFAARGRRSFLPGNQANIGDLMGSVAVDADGGSGVTRPQRPSMNARGILFLRPCVTGAARRGDIRSVRPALGVGVGQYFMRPMTTGTSRRHEKPIRGQREAVNGVHV